MALLYLLHRFEIPSFAIHCNYGLRGDASDKDEELVENMCRLWEIDALTVRLDPRDDNRKNFQNWARNRRYEVFHDLKKEMDARYILTAHHEDDQLETIFQRILRGSGFSAWSGMSITDGVLFRPLLSVSKKEIMNFVQTFHIPYRIDNTNEESTYARNFIRNNWFPELNKLFPGWRENLLGVSDRAEEFEQLTDIISNHVFIDDSAIKRDLFLSYPEPVQRVLLHHFFEKNSIPAELSGKFLMSLSKLADLQTGSKITVSNSLFIVRDREFFVIQEKGNDQKSDSFVISKDDIKNSVIVLPYRMRLDKHAGIYHSDELQFDIAKIKFPVTIRPWKKGERFIPLGMKGTQLISDHLTNRKIPATLKKSSKVLESFDGTVCAVIFPPNSGIGEMGTISDKVRCTDQTIQSLIISYK